MVSSSRLYRNDEQRRAEKNWHEEHQRVQKLRKGLGGLDEAVTLADFTLRRYGRKIQRKSRTKLGPNKLDVLNEALDAIDFLHEEVKRKRQEGVKSSTYRRTEATSTVPEADRGSSSGCSSNSATPVLPIPNHLEQNVTEPCSNDPGRSTQSLDGTDIQEAQHMQMSATNGRMSEPSIQHSLLQCNHSRQLSDAGNSQESVEGYTLDGAVWEQAGFRPIPPSPAYESAIPGPSSWLTPLTSPPLPNHPNHMMMIHPLTPPILHHQQTHSVYVNQIPLGVPPSRQPTPPFWDQVSPPPVSPPGGVPADLFMAHTSSSLREILVPVSF